MKPIAYLDAWLTVINASNLSFGDCILEMYESDWDRLLIPHKYCYKQSKDVAYSKVQCEFLIKLVFQTRYHFRIRFDHIQKISKFFFVRVFCEVLLLGYIRLEPPSLRLGMCMNLPQTEKTWLSSEHCSGSEV